MNVKTFLKRSFKAYVSEGNAYNSDDPHEFAAGFVAGLKFAKKLLPKLVFPHRAIVRDNEKLVRYLQQDLKNEFEKVEKVASNLQEYPGYKV